MHALSMYPLWRLWRLRTHAIATAMIGVMACGSPGVVIPKDVTARAAWGPLQPTYDGTPRAYGKGQLQDRGASVMVLDGVYSDSERDGNGAYVKVTFQERRPSASGTGSSWSQVTTHSTPEIGTSVGQQPILRTDEDPIHYDHARWSDSYQSRAYTRVCAQFGWPVSDPCAVAVPTLPL